MLGALVIGAAAVNASALAETFEDGLVRGEAAAVTAYFIDGRRAVKGLAPIDGCKFQAFVGGGFSVALIWDDVLKEGRKTVQPQEGLLLFDAMGNRLTDSVELGMIPVFAIARGEDAAALMSALANQWEMKGK